MRPVLSVDIETLPAMGMTEQQKRSLVKVPGNVTKDETRQRRIDEGWQEAWQRTSLEPEHGEILCVGVQLMDSQAEEAEPPMVFWGKNELETLRSLEDFIIRHPYRTIVSHNGLTFDWPWLFRRGAKYGLYELARAFRSGPYTNDRFFDTKAVFEGPRGSVGGSSLNTICELFGIERHNPISGAAVYDRYIQGDHQAIRQHVSDDVRVTMEVYKILRKCI